MGKDKPKNGKAPPKDESQLPEEEDEEAGTSTRPSLARAERGPRGARRRPRPAEPMEPSTSPSPSKTRPDPNERLRTSSAEKKPKTKPKKEPTCIDIHTAMLEVKLADVPQNLDLLEWAGLDPADFGIGQGDGAQAGPSGLGSRAPDSDSDESDTMEDMIMNFYDYLMEENYSKHDAILQIADTLKLRVKTVREAVNERLREKGVEVNSDSDDD